MTTFEAKCKKCNKVFYKTAKKNGKLYCSSYCKKAMAKKKKGLILKCIKCGEQYKASYKSSHRKYCSTCKVEILREHQLKRYRKQNNIKDGNKEDLIYLEYKEPLKEVKEGEGFGFYGVIATSKDGNYLQSHCDGKLYKHIGNAHVKRFGFKNVREYKKHYGLAYDTSLIGKSTREKYLDNYYKNKGKKGKLDKFRQNNPKRLKKAIEANKKRKGQGIALETRNKRGNCPDQLLQKIKDLKKENGRVPTKRDFKAKWKGRFLGTIYETFGSWTKAVKLAGMQPVSKQQEEKYSRKMLIQYLKNFYNRFGRTPTRSDHDSTQYLPSVATYYKYWKTLNAARIQAGIPILVRAGMHTVAESMDYRQELSKLSKMELGL